MINQNLVTSKKLSQRLKKLGVKQFGTCFAWAEVNVGNKKWEYQIVKNDFQADIEFIACFLSGELGEILPDRYQKDDYWWVIQMTKVSFSDRPYCVSAVNEVKQSYQHFSAKTEAEARGLLLEYLKENKLI